MTDTFSVTGFSILQTRGELHVLVTLLAPLVRVTPIAVSSTHACPLAAPTKRSGSTMAKIATRYIPTSLVCRPPRYWSPIKAGIDLYDFLSQDKGQLPSPRDTLPCSDAAVLTQSYPRAHTAAPATTASTDDAE